MMTFPEYYDKLKNIARETGDEQVELILNHFKNKTPFAYVRFNDGEMMGIERIGAVAARGDQPINETLHEKLVEGIQHVQKNYYVGLPCADCYPTYSELGLSLVKQPKEYQMGAVVMTNRNWVRFVVEFPKAVVGQNILWISGADQNLSYLTNDLGLNIIGHQKYPSKDTWTHYDVIEHQYLEFLENHENIDIIMVSLGPTARVFCKEMFEKDPTRTYIDIGSTFDPFTRSVWHNCHKGWLETGFNYTKRCKICN